MHRIPLWGAILLLIFQIIIAIIGDTETYIVDQEKLWISITVNFLLIIVPVIKNIYDNRY